MAETALDPNSWMNAGEAATSGGAGGGGGNLSPMQSPAQQALVRAQNPNRENAPQQTPTATPAVNEQMNTDMPQLVMRPKRGGLLGVMDKIADALTGTTKPEIYTDQNGNEYVYHPNLSRGQQWARIGAGMFKGAAAGLAAGRGAGNMGKAALAGAESGEKTAEQLHEQEEALGSKAQKDMLNRANMTLLRMQTVEQAWRAARLQTEANEADAKASRENIDFYVRNGGQVIGTAEHPGDLGTVMGVAPQIAADFVQRHIIEPVTTVDAKGHAGVTFIRMPNADWKKQIVPPKSTFPTFNPATNEIEEHQASDAMTLGELSDQIQKAYGERTKYLNDKQEQATKKAQQQEAEAKANETNKLLPFKQRESQATTAEKFAGAQKDIAEANKAKSETFGTGGGADALANETPVHGVRQNYLASLEPGLQATVKAIGEGREKLPGRGSSAQAMKVRNAVNIAYPGYDETRYDTYQETRKKFTAGSQQAIGNQALNNAMEHMQVMYDAASWLGTTPILGNAMRKAGNQRAIDLKDSQTALVDELGKAYKNGVISQGERDEWKNRIESWSPNEVRGNAKAFIKLLKGKVDSQRHQFEIGSPPGAVADIDWMSPQAKAAWVHINHPEGAVKVQKMTDGKEHYINAQNQDMGVVEYEDETQ